MAHLEREPAGESSGTSTGLAAEGMVAGRGETTTTTAAVHHVEQDVRVDVDVRAVHAAHTAHTMHAMHAMHTAHAAETAAAEHLGWVHQVVAIIVSSTLP